MNRTIPSDATTSRQLVRKEMLPCLDMRPFINGEFVNPITTTSLPIIDPMTRETLAFIPAAGPSEVDAAVTAARAAFR